MTAGLPNILSLALLLSLVYLSVGVLLMLRRLADTGGKALARRIDQVAKGRHAGGEDLADIIKKHEMSGLRWLDVLLSRQAWSQRLDKTLDQADIHAPLGIFVLLSLVFAATGYLAMSLYVRNSLVCLVVAGALGMLPFKWIFMRKSKRMDAFELQLPEALELVGRALKAGHTFGSGMGMVVSEFGDPIRGEFQKTLDEMNFGVAVTVALDNLMDRVDCPDLNFFVVSVKIQSESGGNLAEIVENIAALIRERFKLKGRVRVLSAEGRMAAWVLCLLPIGLAATINVLNPGYMGVFFSDPIGIKLGYLVVVMMAVGIVIIRKMVRIEV
jgi:tight adherence protein B